MQVTIVRTRSKQGCLQRMVSGWSCEEDKRKRNVVHYVTNKGVFIRCNSVAFETLGILYKRSLYMLNKKKVMLLLDTVKVDSVTCIFCFSLSKFYVLMYVHCH